MTRHAVILAGGLGTRLGAMTQTSPKPLLSVAGRPFLEHLIGHLSREGMTKITILAGYRGEDIASHFNTSLFPGVAVETLIEPEPMGTGGALRFAADHLYEHFFLLNGDTFFDLALADLAWGQEGVPPGSLAHVALRHVSDTGRYGVVQRTGMRITDFATHPGREGQAGYINGGVYWLSREILDHIAPGFASLEKDVFPKLARKGRIHGKSYSEAFIDIGMPEDFSKAQEFLPKVLHRPGLFLDRDGVINKDIGHLHRQEDFVWIDGAREVIKRASDLGWYVFVVTNQGGVARGLYKEATVQRLHRWLSDQVFAFGARITDFRYCPHNPAGSVPGYAVPCEWRKPSPGMLLDLIKQHPVDTRKSLMVGDRDTDMSAASTAGLRGLRFDGGNLADLILPHLHERATP